MHTLFHLFATKIGHCGIAWSSAGIKRTTFPALTRRAAADQILADLPLADWTDQPCQDVKKTIYGLCAFAESEGWDFSWDDLDLSVCTTFQKKIYAEVFSIPPGQTMTYSQIARQARQPRAARAVGSAMKRNPLPMIIPCHRVIASEGLGGFAGGIETKKTLLGIEQATRKITMVPYFAAN